MASPFLGGRKGPKNYPAWALDDVHEKDCDNHLSLICLSPPLMRDRSRKVSAKRGRHVCNVRDQVPEWHVRGHCYLSWRAKASAALTRVPRLLTLPSHNIWIRKRFSLRYGERVDQRRTSDQRSTVSHSGSLVHPQIGVLWLTFLNSRGRFVELSHPLRSASKAPLCQACALQGRLV